MSTASGAERGAEQGTSRGAAEHLARRSERVEPSATRQGVFRSTVEGTFRQSFPRRAARGVGHDIT